MRLLLFIFYQKNAFQKLWKMVFISSKNLFLTYSVFCCCFPFLSTVFRFKASYKKWIFLSTFCNLMRDWLLVPGLSFHNLVYKNRLDAKEKIKSTFSWYLLKHLIFSHMLFRAITKIKKRYGTNFSIKMLFKCSSKFQYLGRVALWVKALQSESEGSWFKPH